MTPDPRTELLASLIVQLGSVPKENRENAVSGILSDSKSISVINNFLVCRDLSDSVLFSFQFG